MTRKPSVGSIKDSVRRAKVRELDKAMAPARMLLLMLHLEMLSGMTSKDYD